MFYIIYINNIYHYCHYYTSSNYGLSYCDNIIIPMGKIEPNINKNNVYKIKIYTVKTKKKKILKFVNR